MIRWLYGESGTILLMIENLRDLIYSNHRNYDIIVYIWGHARFPSSTVFLVFLEAPTLSSSPGKTPPPEALDTIRTERTKVGSWTEAVPQWVCVYMGGCQNNVPYWLLIIMRHVVFRGPKKGP